MAFLHKEDKARKPLSDMNDWGGRGFKALQHKWKTRGIVELLLFFGTRGILHATMKYN